MVNTLLLVEKIKESGLKREYLASKLGITRQAFLNKVNRKTDFTAREIKILCKELNITKLTEKEEIFFAD